MLLRGCRLVVKPIRLFCISLIMLTVISQHPLQAAEPIGFSDARHLLARTGFGIATPADVEVYAKLSRAEAVDRLFSTTVTSAVTPPPDWIGERAPPPSERKAMTSEQRILFQKLMRRRGEVLKAWWYREMLETPSPFTERMVMFWHNNFTSSLKKVKWPAHIYRQNRLFREQAFGDFRSLTAAVTRDPAMLIYLDGQKNVAGAPNENFARELFELFTLGAGNYAETDIREAARAFSGLKYDEKSGIVRLFGRRHDSGLKTVFGTTGNFAADDIMAVLFEQPAVARFIAGKLWREFVSPVPDEVEINAIADVFRSSGYSVAAALRQMLTADSFYDLRHRGALIKSPLDMLVGTARLFSLSPSSTEPLVRLGRQLGQDVFDPPNVAGWEGDQAWIDSTTLLLRQDLVRRFSSGDAQSRMQGVSPRLSVLVSSDLSRAELTRLLLPIPPVRVPDQNADIGQMLAGILSDPVFQLK